MKTIYDEFTYKGGGRWQHTNGYVQKLKNGLFFWQRQMFAEDWSCGACDTWEEACLAASALPGSVLEDA